jgi:peroxiredoxin
LWPHERSLVKKLNDKPFALVGINTNSDDAKHLKEVMEKENLTWRSFADHRNSICETWNLTVTPTLFVLDANGVIRHKWFGSPGDRILDAALEHLIQEAERPKQSRP